MLFSALAVIAAIVIVRWGARWEVLLALGSPRRPGNRADITAEEDKTKLQLLVPMLLAVILIMLGVIAERIGGAF